MSSQPDKLLQVTEVLRGAPPEWPKRGSLHSLLKKLTGAEAESDAAVEIEIGRAHV